MTFIYNTPINFNIPKISFRSNPAVYNPQGIPSKDGFQTNPLYENIGKSLEAEAKQNPVIKEILGKYNLPVKINTRELEKLQQGHLKDTRVVAAKMYSALPQEMKNEVNLSELQEAAMFHDFGKALIPDSILNKAGKLDEKEQEIMQLHSELGYELLKNKGLSENTLNMIKYHHQTAGKTGYPMANSDFEYTIGSQILSTADKYTALREQRSYKDAMSHQEALAIIEQDSSISPEILEALKKSI